MNWMRYFLVARQLRQTNYRQLRLWCNGSRVLLALATLDVPNVKLYDGAWVNGARGQIYRLSQ